MIRHSRMLALLLATGLAACSSSNQDVETGPAPRTQTIPGTGSNSGSEPELKNDHVPDNASTAARFGIPPGHLPAPGQCRIWMPGAPPGKQKKNPSGDCGSLSRNVPDGSWLVYRPSDDKKEVVVREYGAGDRVTSIRVFDVVTGALLREIEPDDQG